MKIEVIAATSGKLKGEPVLRIKPGPGERNLPEFDTLIDHARSTRVPVDGQTGQIPVQLPGKSMSLYTRQAYDDARNEFVGKMR